MAGAGSRFVNKGYSDPKPLIKVNGVPMIKIVINNVKPRANHRFIFICQNEHIKNYSLEEKLKSWAPGCLVVGINGLTEGAACTVLYAKEFINNESPLMIVNSDQYVDVDINSYLNNIEYSALDGQIMTMSAEDPKWSFVELDKKKYVIRVVEKEVISNEATVGIYNFSRGSFFVKAVEKMISNDNRVNGEFYVAPVYNELIKDGYRFGIFNVGSEGNGMYGLGIPEDLDYFINHPVSIKAC